MNLVEINDFKVRRMKKELLLSGASKVNAYSLSTGSTIIHSVVKGKEHISISNYSSIPTSEEMNFAVKQLMKPDINVHVILPRETNHLNIKTYIGHILEIENRVVI